MSLRVFAPGSGSGGGSLGRGTALALDGDESRYLRRVRRARDGAQVEVIDGQGGLWGATIVGGDARETTLRLGDPIAVPAPPRALTLLLGLPEPAAALAALTAATTLGVAAIALVSCARSQGRAPDPSRIARVLQAAQRQCGRPSLPTIAGPMGLAEALGREPDLPGLVAAMELRGQRTAPPLPPLGPAARLLIGPEGGLTPEECAWVAEAGWSPLSLGPFTLRTEDAALVGLTRLLFAPTTTVSSPHHLPPLSPCGEGVLP